MSDETKQPGYTQEQWDGDFQQMILPSLISFYGMRTEELGQLAETLLATGFGEIGVFMRASARAHQQMFEWARDLLSEPCPPLSDEPLKATQWLTCHRLLRRHAECWSFHPEYLDDWFPEDE